MSVYWLANTYQRSSHYQILNVKAVNELVTEVSENKTKNRKCLGNISGKLHIELQNLQL